MKTADRVLLLWVFAWVLVGTEAKWHESLIAISLTLAVWYFVNWIERKGVK